MALPRENRTGPYSDIDPDMFWGRNLFLREASGSMYYFGVFTSNRRKGDLDYLYGPDGETLALLSAKRTRYRLEEDDVVLLFPGHPDHEYVLSPRVEIPDE